MIALSDEFLFLLCNPRPINYGMAPPAHGRASKKPSGAASRELARGDARDSARGEGRSGSLLELAAFAMEPRLPGAQ